MSYGRRRGLTAIGAVVAGLALAVGMAVGDVTPGPSTTFRATAGEPATGVVAEFVSCTEGVTASAFTATIAWGDGTSSSSGTITEEGIGSGTCGSGTGTTPARSPKRFVVRGTHVYAAAGTYETAAFVREGRATAVTLRGRAEVTAPESTTTTTTTSTTTTTTTSTTTATAPPEPRPAPDPPAPAPSDPPASGPPAPADPSIPRVDLSGFDPEQPVVAGTFPFAATVDRPVRSARLEVGGRSIPLPVTCLTCGTDVADHEGEPGDPVDRDRYEVGGIDVRLPAGTTPVLHVTPEVGIPVSLQVSNILAAQPGVKVDVGARGVELTQGLQSDRGTIVGPDDPVSGFIRYKAGMALPSAPKLIARRPSLLRVYPVYDRPDRAPDDVVLPVVVEVRAERDGRQLSPGPVFAVASAVPSRLASGPNPDADVTTRRGKARGSAVIAVPPEWTVKGTTTFTVRVKTFFGQPTCDTATCTADDELRGLRAKFAESPRLTVHAYGLELKDLSKYPNPKQQQFLKAPSQAEVLATVDESWKWLSVSPDALQTVYHGSLNRSGYQGAVGEFDMCDLLGTAPYPNFTGTLDLPLTVIQQEVWADARGCAYLGVPGAVVGSRLDLTTAHELGHNLGLHHAGCSHGEQNGGGCEQDFPIEHGALDGVPVDPASGEVQTASLTGSEHTHDLMSYGSNRWISSITAARLFLRIPVEAERQDLPSLRVARAATGPAGGVQVRGVVDGETATLTEVADAPPGTRTGGAAGSDLELQALDAAGVVLESRPIALRPVSRPGPAAFSVLMARRAGVARYAVVRGIAQLGQLAVLGGPAPTVTPPRAPAKLSPRGRVTVRWTARGSGLRHALSVSSDGGRTWTALADGLDRPRVTVPASALPSGRLRFRAAVTDGTRVAAAAGRPVVAADRPPAVRVVAPIHRAVLTAGRAVALSAVAADGEDGSLRRKATWRSSREGRIGPGASRSWTPRRTGTHTLTLTVTDARGQTASAKRVVRVYPALVKLR